ncbi:MAG: phage tail protein [Leptolyngbyaceae cyanobacterium bins.59]|nr:phage tail protein [Leptolyngbyaceae cyanobacterium bins.59]
MTQTRADQLLRLQFFPSRISEAVMPVDLDTGGQNLVLHPGESAQFVVQMQNLGEQPLAIDLRLEGECPLAWYDIGMEGRELAPGQRMEAVIQFRVPADFFENPQVLRQGEQLTLNFQNDVLVNFREVETGRQSLDGTALNLYVRPRSRYLQYLPALYQEVDFIGRLLKVFEQAFDPIVQSLNGMWANLDPLTAPEALLPFLAHWVGWNLDARWSPDQQRRLIRNAMDIYRWRGTRQGLRLFLHLYTDLPLDEDLPETEKHICIQGASYKAFNLGFAYLGLDTAVGRGRPYHFLVHLRPEPDRSIDESLIRHIIEQEKPAFCTYELFIGEL